MSENLLDYAHDKYSQAGQDGILERVFDVCGIRKGYFAEFGAWDGVRGSNCRKLFEEGWKGIFIESNHERFSVLKANYKNSPNIIVVNRIVRHRGTDSFDNIIAEYAPDAPFDFISVDIDGLDLEVFEGIEKYLPKVALIEGGKGPHPFDPRMPAWAIDNVGQSLKIIDSAARRKGYQIICSFQDVILVRQEYAHLFDTKRDLWELWVDGYKAQSFIHVPLYCYRLMRQGRRNKILNYVLAETRYSKYSKSLRKASKRHQPTILWEQENRDRIMNLLDNLPPFLRYGYAKPAEKMISSIAGLILVAVRKIKGCFYG